MIICQRLSGLARLHPVLGPCEPSKNHGNKESVLEKTLTYFKVIRVLFLMVHS